MLKELSTHDLKNEYFHTLAEIEKYDGIKERLKEINEKENKGKYERVLDIRRIREYLEKMEGKREMIKKIFRIKGK